MSGSIRYSRQTALSEIREAGQEKLSGARALVIGAGGLGCPALLYLAGAGIGTIGIVDFDRVDESNLQRQVLFTAEDCEKPKAASAKIRLSALNPEIKVNAYDEELTNKNSVGLFSDYDVIIDGTDNFSAKFLINDVAVKLKKPFVYGAIQGFESQVSVFNHKGGPCYR
ncbi:MAG: HesA/MoeB/ThiF family protein, partial [Proteobacteria bacterium]|nr:HesA/MoeB/ThiF family protein [Pseudomonadota bacterium]